MLRARDIFQACLAVTGVVSARTVAWYQLNGLTVGETATAQTVVTNVANPEILQGANYSILSNSLQNVDAGVPKIQSGEWMPRGVEGLGANLWVYDPVTGTGSERLTALHFGMESCKSTDAHGHGSVVYVPDAGASLYLSEMTVEVIYRPVETFPAGWNFCPLVMLQGIGDTMEAWTLAFGWNGKLAFRSGNKACQTSSAIVPGINGKWHHAAFTLANDGTVTLFQDYNAVKSDTGYSVAQSKPSDWAKKFLAIGAHPQREGRAFPGEILDVRISDTVLSSDQFLRVRVPPRETPPETVVYAPMDAAIGASWTDFVTANAATGTETVVVKARRESTSPLATVDGTDMSGAAYRFGIDDPRELSPNAASLHLNVGEDNNGNGLVLAANPKLEDGDFTFEFFFKTPGQVPAGTTWTLFRSPCVKVCIGTAVGKEGRLLLRGFTTYKSYDGIKDQYGTFRVDDGRWHHVAGVYTVANHTFKLYVDYMLQKSDVVTLATNGTAAPSIGWQNDWTGDKQYFPGWMDEVRITKKALGPESFLIADPIDTVDALAQIDFDDSDFSVDPYPSSLNRLGEGSARTGGSEPSFSTECRSPLALDGEDGLVRKQNVRSLELKGGEVYFPNLYFLKGKTSFTAEWFMKLTACDAGASILRLDTETGMKDQDPLWRIYVSDANKNALLLRAWAGGDKRTPNWGTLPSRVDDGRWHHYAVTLDTASVDGKTVCSLYRDYKLVGSVQPFTGYLAYGEATKLSLKIGSDGNLTGLIDEIRFSDGVLPVKSFMRAAPNGTLVLFR